MITTVSAKPAAGGAAPTLNLQVAELWNATWGWFWSHSLQILIGSAVAAVIVLLLIGAKLIGIKLCESDPANGHWRTTFGRMLAKTRLWFMLIVAARLVAGYADAPPLVAETIGFLFTIAATFQVALWARELVLGIVEHRAGMVEDASSFGSAIGIIRLLISIAIFAIATIVVLDNLHVNVTGLIAGLGIGGIAIGLAAQGIFADLFAALSIIFDKPFRRGDSVTWDKTSGTVERIGLKSTRVRAVTGEEVVISNTNLLSKELHNMARLDRRRIVQPFGIVYQTPPELCARIPKIVEEIVHGCSDCALVRCGMTGYGPSALNFELQFDVHSEIYQVVFDARSQVLIRMLERFNAEGIAFAYPTQTSFTAAPDGTFIMPYPMPPPQTAPEGAGNSDGGGAPA